MSEEYYLVLRPWFFQSLEISTIVSIVYDMHSIVMIVDGTDDQVRMAKILLKEIYDFHCKDFGVVGEFDEVIPILRKYI